MSKEELDIIFAERLSDLIHNSNYILSDMEETVGKTSATISRYATGEITGVKRSTIVKLANFFKVNPAWLAGLSDDKYVINKKNESNSAVVLVYGNIPAGVPIECIEDIIDTEEISADMLRGNKQYFGLKVKGNSMEPEYIDGDTLILLKQDDCESGDDCVVMVNGCDGTFKRVFKNENGIILQPLNPTYAPLVFTNEQIEKLPVKILGIVEEIRRKKKRRK